jgi:hypothetical protein
MKSREEEIQALSAQLSQLRSSTVLDKSCGRGVLCFYLTSQLLLLLLSLQDALARSQKDSERKLTEVARHATEASGLYEVQLENAVMHHGHGSLY